ncbi:hypothetical protein ACXPWS_11970 [Mycobacterium sp. BMJ-28]
MPTVKLEHATISYQQCGPLDSPLPPVLFVHGMLNNEQLWTGVAQRLAQQGIRCIVPTWPLGSHIIPVDAGADLSVPGLAAMVDEFMNHPRSARRDARG